MNLVIIVVIAVIVINHHHHHNDDRMHFFDCHLSSAAEHICNCLFRTSIGGGTNYKLLCKETGSREQQGH